MGVKDRIAIVTGAGRGIGRGIAEALACEGASLMLVARHEEEISKVEDYIKTNKWKAEHITGDICLIEDMNKVVEATLNAFGRIDILVACAASALAVRPSETLPFAEWERVIKTDLNSEEAMVWRTPAKRLGEPADVAAAVLLLASEEAGFVNGQKIVVDGGWTVSSWWGKYTKG